MDFMRFGSSIPGEYWGCCAASIIQNFTHDPDTKASSQLTSGDSNSAIMRDGELAFAGPTLKDIFETRIRIGEFSDREMPNHVFFAILTDSQCSGEIGKKWLKILKDNGFEFFRRVNNSVWNVNNNVFILARNCGPNAVKDPFEPPAAWKALPQVVPEPWEGITGEARTNFIRDMNAAQAKIWKETPKVKILKESEIVAAGAPVIMGALRTEFPPELKVTRQQKLDARTKAKLPVQPSAGTQHIY